MRLLFLLYKTHLKQEAIYFNISGEALAVRPEFRRAHWKDMFTGRMKTEIPPALINLTRGIMTAQARLVELDLSDNAFGPIGNFFPFLLLDEKHIASLFPHFIRPSLFLTIKACQQVLCGLAQYTILHVELLGAFDPSKTLIDGSVEKDTLSPSLSSLSLSPSLS